MMEKKVKLRSVNSCITCTLCRGYLIEATTITECLHTFCKSCLVRYLEDHNSCPKCQTLIHQSHPMNYISHDRTMQDIVYKLVPNLQQKELRRQQDFFRKHASQGIKPECEDVNDNHTESAVVVKEENKDHHRNDEQLNVCLECQGTMKNLKRKFLRISSQATVSHLKKFVALKLYSDQTKYTNIEILCNDELLGKHHTLKFVAVTRWRVKDGPLLLHYRQKTLDF